jgi:hypothetical protein
MKRVSLFLRNDLRDGLAVLKRRHGTPEAESIRRAIEAYLRANNAVLRGASFNPDEATDLEPKKRRRRRRRR